VTAACSPDVPRGAAGSRLSAGLRSSSSRGSRSTILPCSTCAGAALKPGEFVRSPSHRVGVCRGGQPVHREGAAAAVTATVRPRSGHGPSSGDTGGRAGPSVRRSFERYLLSVLNRNGAQALEVHETHRSTGCARPHACPAAARIAYRPASSVGIRRRSSSSRPRSASLRTCRRASRVARTIPDQRSRSTTS